MRLKIKKSGSYKFSKKYLDLIANSKVYDVAEKTPTTFAGNLSSKLKNDIFLILPKLEHQQALKEPLYLQKYLLLPRIIHQC